MYFFFGLGNPGKEFIKTPHNIGFMVLDFLGKKLNSSKWKKKNLSTISKVFLEGEEIFLVKPMTYMNLSGQAVLKFLKEGSLKKEKTLIIYDDINLPFGSLRLKLKGSSGGHKGMESIINAFNSKEIPRLRVGVGPCELDPTIFVLSPFPEEKLSSLETIFSRIFEGLKIYVKDKDKAMQFFNTKINNADLKKKKNTKTP